MIQFNQVSKCYDNNFQALTNVSFTLEQGEMAFLTGHSGAGKSTLLKLVALLETPSKGEIVVNQKTISRLSKHQIPLFRQELGIIFQDPMLLPDKTVFENVAIPLILKGERFLAIKKSVFAALDKVGLLDKVDAYPDTLSCGERQRVDIARAIVKKPSVLLADEPTGNLDPDLSDEIMKLFAQFNELGMTTLIVSHDLALIEKMPYPVLTLEKGQLVAEGDV